MSNRIDPDPVSISHLNNVPWWDAPAPKRSLFRRHKCSAQTRGWINYFDEVERCACGGIRVNHKGRFKDRFSSK